VRRDRASPGLAAGDTLVTPCRPTAPSKRSDKRKVYVHPLELPPVTVLPEVARRDLRALAGAAWPAIWNKSGVAQAIRWAMHDLAGRGYYLMTYRDSGFVSDRFFGSLAMTAPTAIEDGRYFVASGCAEAQCLSGAILIVDLQTGQLAGGIVHEFDAAGTGFYEYGHLTVFLRRCADPDLAGFAKARASRWAQQVLSARHGAAYPGLEAPSLVEATCG
jgi:hypothetical protein